MSDDTYEAPAVSAEFANVPPDVLQEYLDGSPIQPGEDHDHWAMRNRMGREKLLVAYPPDSEK
jgi:hypothetical protein